MKLLTGVLVALVALTLACGNGDEAPAMVEDIYQAAPEQAQMLLENEHVAVARFTVAPRAELPMHPGTERVVYSLSDYKVQIKRPGIEPRILDFRKGNVNWYGAGTHGVRNVGPITAEYLVVARKAPNPTPGVTSNLAELAPEMAKVVFENEEGKVLEVSLDAGAKQPVHAAAGRVVYALTDAKLKFTAGEESMEKELAAGEVHWHDGGDHQVENVSEGAVRYLVVELM